MAKRNKYDYQAVFDRYTENPDLKYANIIHIYGQKATTVDDRVDRKYIKVVAYNNETMEKKTSIDDYHDDIDLIGIEVYQIGIFADNSTLVKLKKPYRISFNIQTIQFFKS